jgi:predicted transcriptional regulator
MAGRKTLAITDRQYQILQILWDHGPLTVRQLVAHLPCGNELPYTTVLSMVQNMDNAGLLSHEKEGVTYRYAAAVSRQEGTGRLLHDFLRRFFGGSAEALVQGLVDTQALSARDLKEIEAKLTQASKTRPQPKRQASQRRRTGK